MIYTSLLSARKYPLYYKPIDSNGGATYCFMVQPHLSPTRLLFKGSRNDRQRYMLCCPADRNIVARTALVEEGGLEGGWLASERGNKGRGTFYDPRLVWARLTWSHLKVEVPPCPMWSVGTSASSPALFVSLGGKGGGWEGERRKCRVIEYCLSSGQSAHPLKLAGRRFTWHQTTHSKVIAAVFF